MLALIIIFFVVIFAVIIGCVGAGFAYFRQKQKQQIQSMLRKAEESPAQQRGPDLLRPSHQESFLSEFLNRFAFTEKLNAMLDQAGSSSTASKTLTTCFITAVIAGVAGFKFNFTFPPTITCLSAAALGSVVPIYLVSRKRKKIIAKFEEQFPEALDFLSRSMRAGHGFSVALELLATDSPDPLGRSFRRVSNDMALGSSLEIALGKLIALVPTVDVRFFVSAVVLQQETGGNLGEILTKLAHIIRERAQLKGTVKAVSAHGRITGLVLLLMPLGVVAFLLFTNPDYLTGMITNPIGRMMIWGAIGGQFIGYLVIKKIIAIKV